MEKPVPSALEIGEKREYLDALWIVSNREKAVSWDLSY